MSLRITPEMKIRLDKAARQSGRSQSQEAEFRLARTFEREDMLVQAMSLTFNHELTGVLRVLGKVMQEAGFNAMLDMRIPQTPEEWRELPDRLSQWLSDPVAFDQAMRGAVAALSMMRPPGNPAPKGRGPLDQGEGLARSAIEALINFDRTGPTGEWARSVRPSLLRLIGHFSVAPGRLHVGSTPEEIAGLEALIETTRKQKGWTE